MKIVIKNVIQFDIIRKFHEISRKNYFLLKLFVISNFQTVANTSNIPTHYFCAPKIYTHVHTTRNAC